MFSVEPSGRVNHALLFTLPGQPAPVDEPVNAPATVPRAAV